MKKVLYSTTIALSITLLGCSIQKMKALSSCEFKLDQINSIIVAGVKINPNGGTNLTLIDGLKIMESLSKKQLPLSVDLTLNGNNPNTVEAQMSKFDWKMKIKDQEILTGTMGDGVRIPASSNANFNFNSSTDVYSVLSKYSLEELKSLVKNAVDENGNPKELKLFIKPYLAVGKVNIPYPGFIEISKYYKSN